MSHFGVLQQIHLYFFQEINILLFFSFLFLVSIRVWKKKNKIEPPDRAGCTEFCREELPGPENANFVAPSKYFKPFPLYRELHHRS